MATFTQPQTRAESSHSDAPAISISQLAVGYGSHVAVDDLSFDVPVGSIFGFLGPNGAGKTTTIKTLLGFRPPHAGSAQVLGLDCVRDSIEIRARIGYVSETNSMYDYLTIPRICAFCRDAGRRWDQPVVDRYIEEFGLPRNAKIKQLSRGMKSQLALALALGTGPELLILDEPTTGLDPLARHKFLNTVVGDFAAQGKTIFFSSHILSEVEAVADHVAIINNGKLVVADELDNLKATQKVLKVAYAGIPAPSEIEELKKLPGVGRVQQEGRNVRILVRDDSNGLAQALALRPTVANVDTVNLNLEDLFLEYMKEGSSVR